MPELFPPQSIDDSIDDGKVDLAKLRATLNTLLHGEAGASVESAHCAEAPDASADADVAPRVSRRASPTEADS
jgi:hypothetical protein